VLVEGELLIEYDVESPLTVLHDAELLLVLGPFRRMALSTTTGIPLDERPD
jgi:hypothetical protein